ncbi:hypothetical protein E1265_12790 [Streptomyces sp. 8K308]|uniref:hypothetical protein n=1 Tax=Streptomyces sp. 8K308 TaxID=2530388 RepID=UPI0010454BF8|nr:hypothetical protein [Streptomyces sp. 8K308]TDC23409.1 hypothetical protein E1265_12790 [Streptomyces sp. 8K308]
MSSGANAPWDRASYLRRNFAEARDIELDLAAILSNAGSKEILRTYGYSDREQPPSHPGVGVVFRSGAKAFCMFS